MDRTQALALIEEAFRECARPEGLMIYGTCGCSECEEHNATLASHTPQSMDMKAFGNPGWDPMCTASDASFLYFLPGMFRLAFEEDGGYMDQLLFHLGRPNRQACFTAPQAKAMAAALRAWVELYPEQASDPCYFRDVDGVLKQLDEIGNSGS